MAESNPTHDNLTFKGSLGSYNFIDGSNCTVMHSHCIVLGDGLESDHDYQLKIGSRTHSSFVRMTHEQWERLRGALDDVMASNRRGCAIGGIGNSVFDPGSLGAVVHGADNFIVPSPETKSMFQRIARIWFAPTGKE